MLLHILSKTHNHFLSAILVLLQCYYTAIYSESGGVLCFHYSRMRVVNDTNHICGHMRTTNLHLRHSALGDFILQPPSLHLESEFQVHYPLSLFLNEFLLPFNRMR